MKTTGVEPIVGAEEPEMVIKVKRRTRPQVRETFAPQSVLAAMDGGLFKIRPVDEDIYLGIDPSLTGYALAAINNDGEHMVWRIETKPDRPLTLRLFDIERFIEERLQEMRLRRMVVQAICYEAASFGSEFGRETVGRLEWVTMRTLAHHFGVAAAMSYPYMVAPASLKKFVTGSGKGPKDQISKSLLKKHDLDVPSVRGANDLADALGLALLARMLYRDDPTTQYEREVLKTVRPKREWDLYKEHASKPRAKSQSS